MSDWRQGSSLKVRKDTIKIHSTRLFSESQTPFKSLHKTNKTARKKDAREEERYKGNHGYSDGESASHCWESDAEATDEQLFQAEP